MKFVSSAEIDTPLETVWEVIKDPVEWPQWVPSLKKIEKVTEGPLKEGTQVRVIAKSGIITLKLFMTITEFVPKQCVIMKGKILGSTLIRSYTLETVNNKTIFNASGEVSGLASWLICRRGQALSDEIVQSLKKKIEEYAAINN